MDNGMLARVREAVGGAADGVLSDMAALQLVTGQQTISEPRRCLRQRWILR